nr:hypothetical protein [uncultured Mucilaginibacter sp.]
MRNNNKFSKNAPILPQLSTATGGSTMHKKYLIVYFLIKVQKFPDMNRAGT